MIGLSTAALLSDWCPHLPCAKNNDNDIVIFVLVPVLCQSCVNNDDVIAPVIIGSVVIAIVVFTMMTALLPLFLVAIMTVNV